VSFRARLGQIAAMARRDLRVQRTYHFQLLTQLANIPLVLGTYFFLGKLVGRSAALSSLDGGYFEFALIGFMTVSFATVALSAFSQGIAAEQQGGTLEVLLSSPAARLSVLLSGSLAVPFGLAAIQAVLLFSLGWVMAGGSLEASGLLLAVVLLGLTMGSFGALGILSAALMLVTKRGDPLSGFVLQGTSLLAGAVFPVTLLPGPLRAAAQLLPAYYGFDGMRRVLLGDAGLAEIAPQLLALTAFLVVLVPLSLFVFGRAVEIGRITGTLQDAG